MSGHLCLKWNNHSVAFINSISNIQTKEKYCDATIACQGKYFPVHRVILSTCSEYFEEMFERIDCPHPYIVFKDIEPCEMELLLNYMYQGEVNVVQEKLPTLIKAAEALKIKGLAVPDDLPSTKESSGRKRSHQGDDSSSYSKRRNDEKRKRTSTDLHTQSDSHSDSVTSNLVSRVEPDIEEEPKSIKQEPVDNSEYSESNEFDGSEAMTRSNVLPSALNEREALNKTENEYSEYDHALSSENSFTKSEDNLPSEETYDNQSSSWTDFRDSDLQNLSMPQTSQQDDGSWYRHLGGGSAKAVSAATSSPSILSKAVDSQRRKTFRCPYCPYETSTSDVNMVKLHIKYKHSGKRPFACPICFKLFNDNFRLQRHVRTHTGERPFHCHLCSKKFSQKSHLNRHLKTCHH